MAKDKQTKVIILAAGMGTRLAQDIPKPLISLANEKTIIDFQIEKLSQYIPVDNIIVVVGYKKEIVMEKHPELTYVYNEAYARTNTGKSLLRAIKKIDDDVIWLNGDVFFDQEIISKLIESDHSCILTDNKKCGEEEIKFTTDSQGNIKELSKTVKNGEGEGLGINLIKKDLLPAFKNHLAAVDDQDYFEKAIENMIKDDKAEIKPLDSEGLFCQEIDFEEDLLSVKKKLQEK